MTLSEIYDQLNNGNYAVVESEIKRLNTLYRAGKPEIKDKEYDILIETFQFLCPNSDVFNSGVIESEDEINPERKEELKYPMFSLDKFKSISEIIKWAKLNNLPLSTVLICTAKYDGISILKEEFNQLAWSRGDGLIGEKMHEHYKVLNDKANKFKIYTIGELLFPKKAWATHTFLKDDGTPYKNARNMMAGLKNSDVPSPYLQYVDHVRYGFAEEDFTKNKSEQLDWITENLRPVPYKKFRIDQLDDSDLTDLFVEWCVEYDCDGLVFDIEDKDIRKKLGRETNNNPAYAKAYKNPDWAEKTETELRYSTEYPEGVEWNISKNGKLAPVCLLEPFEIEGVTIKRATGYNAKFIKDNNIGKGCKVVVIRSGSVIPKIIGVTKAGDVELPTHCPCCNSKLEWSDTGVDLMCKNPDCKEVKFLKVSFFFTKYEIAGFAEKTIRRIFDAGYDSVGKILRMTKQEFEAIDGMAGTSASKTIDEFNNKIINTTFDTICHASGSFENLGSRKIKMIYDGIMDIDANTQSFEYLKEDLKTSNFNMLAKLLKHDHSYEVIKNQLITIKGVSVKTAEQFLDGLINFDEFISDLDMITISDNIKKPTVSLVNCVYKPIDMSGREFVFTGVRDAELKAFIESCGGVVKDSIGKTTTDLITKDEDSTSSKAQKAIKVGAAIWQIDKFKNSLK
jgi:DNA ligase (NAD+)